MRGMSFTAVLAAALALGLSGCKLIATIGILTQPRQIQKTQFHLTKERLAIVIESAVPGQDDPVFSQALHERIVEIFREKDVTSNVVPYFEMMRLRQQHADYGRWSLQRIGRELAAEQVLYVRIEDLRMRVAPDSPALEPAVLGELKVIGVHELGDAARLWPPRSELQGYKVNWQRQARDVSSEVSVDVETAKLAREFAWEVAAPFHDVDLEATRPRED